MTDAVEKRGGGGELADINRKLADLLHTNPADLRLGADAALADEIIICGILGGKDVGKSTLINALAKTEVSVDPTEVGKGTERPMAYVHEATQPTVESRLHDLHRYTPLDVTLHHADAVRNVVLIDLPDFDSEFADHLEVVRRITPLLDRVLWVLTPRKIGDRAWVEMSQDVMKDPHNVHCVLNKVDELLADAEPFEGPGDSKAGKDGKRAQAFWQRQQEWVGRWLETVECAHSPNQRFSVAAAFPELDSFVDRIGRLWDDPDWARYETDKEAVAQVARLVAGDLNRLRSCVLGPVSADKAVAVKEANRRREQQANAARLRRHFDLDRVMERLALACDASYHQQVLNEALGASYCAAVAEGIQTQLRPATELADRVLERRVEHWPLLRLVYWPFGWLSRILGRRVSPLSPRPATAVADPLFVEGRSLLERIELMRSRIRADHASVIGQLQIESELPTAGALEKRAGEVVRRLAPQLEQRLLDDIRSRDRRPSILGKAAVWLVLLWFPFVQPIGEGILQMLSEGGGLNTTLGLYKIVSALSALHLLAGFAVVAGIYVAILAGMYARALRAVRKAQTGQEKEGGLSPLADAVDEIVVSEVVVPLARPFQHRLERLASLQARLDTAITT